MLSYRSTQTIEKMNLFTDSYILLQKPFFNFLLADGDAALLRLLQTSTKIMAGRLVSGFVPFSSALPFSHV